MRPARATAVVVLIGLTGGLVACLASDKGTAGTAGPMPKLVATIGMPFAEVDRLSSLELGEPGLAAEEDHAAYLYPTDLAGETPPFDFELHGSKLRYEGCRIARVETERAGERRVVNLEVSVSPRLLSWTEMQRELGRTHEMLLADGWQPVAQGSRPARDDLAELIARPEAEIRGDNGSNWSKGRMYLEIFVRDRSAPGTPAGEYVQRLSIDGNPFAD